MGIATNLKRETSLVFMNWLVFLDWSGGNVTFTS